MGFGVYRGPRRLMVPMVALIASAGVYDWLARQESPVVPPLVFALGSLILLGAWAFIVAARSPRDQQ